VEQNRFFIWISRITSILFLLLIAIAIGFTVYGIFQSKNRTQVNTVEVVSESDEAGEYLKLSNIVEVCGVDSRYVKLNSSKTSRGFISKGGYGVLTRNIVFFVGVEMESHWLFDNDKYLINEIAQLSTKSYKCEDKKVVSIYYEIIKSDTNNDGDLNSEDNTTIAITSPDGQNYIELDTDITSVIDHSVDNDAKTLTILMQKGSLILMKRFSLENNQMISEEEISRIGKKL